MLCNDVQLPLPLVGRLLKALPWTLPALVFRDSVHR